MNFQLLKNIQRYVDSGQYFEDAKTWYAGKFLMPYTERAVVLFLGLWVVAGTYLLMKTTVKDFEIKEYPFPIYALDQVKYFPYIKAISEIKEPINISVARYLASDYVKLREGYWSFDYLDENKDFLEKRIAALSSRRMYREYLNFIDPRLNPDSPLIKYKNQVQRNIAIKLVELSGAPGFPERAVITYTATERSAAGEVTTTHMAEMNFTLLDLEKEKKFGSNQIGFTVTSYQTYQL